jgi:hypothetical protein
MSACRNCAVTLSGDVFVPYLRHEVNTYLCTKIDQLGDNTTDIKNRISHTRKAINALNFIWWHKRITKNRK